MSKKKWSLPVVAMMTVVFTVAMVGGAIADNLQSDLNTSTGGLDKTVNRGTLSPNTGYSQNVFLFVQTQPGATNDPVYPFNVTLDTATPGSFGTAFSGVQISGPETANGQTGQVTWTTPAAQTTTQNYSLVVSFLADTTLNENPATVTIDFSIPAAPADNTSPVITHTITGTLGNNGWYKSDVTVTFIVSDPDSAVTSRSADCDATNSVTNDTTGVTFTCTATSEGGTSTDSVTIKRDATAPTISGGASPVANGDGWNKTDVTVSYSCDDNLSGVASCGPDETLSTEGAGQSSTGTAVDNAGNSATDTVSGINIDKTDPTVSLVGGPTNGASYYFGFVPTAPTCTASDGLSGLNGTCTVSGYSTAVGSHTVSASATDKAGNTASASASYQVLAWTLNGFYQPVDMNVMNYAKNGSTVPLKFEVFAGSTELTDTSVVQHFTQKINCDEGIGDDIELYATGSTSLRYDTTGGQFVFNWQTPKQKGACYRVTMQTLDGTKISATFQLK
jgi:hypothetical protein